MDRNLNSARILIVDDDVELCGLLEQKLTREHFRVEVAHDGRHAIQRVSQEDYDLVLLDVMLPQVNGLEVLRQIRTSSNVPVLMLSAKGEDIDRIVGLEMGADDYLAKPFDPRELLARIHAIFRRTASWSRSSPTGSEPSLVEVGDLQLNTGTRTVSCGKQPVKLTAVEFDLLECLVRRAGTIVSRTDLCEQVLGREYSPIDRSIDIHISHLRKKLSRGEDRIKTIRSVGYIYTLSAEPSGASEPREHRSNTTRRAADTLSS
jgi:two-component system response regulator CpxR